MVRPTSPTILPDHTSLHLVRLEADEQFILAVVATTASEAFCPLCQSRSESIHSRYVRCVADLLMARVGRCGWNCTCGAFSARIKHVYARSSRNVCPAS
jgi:hypothetical protein